MNGLSNGQICVPLNFTELSRSRLPSPRASRGTLSLNGGDQWALSFRDGLHKTRSHGLKYPLEIFALLCNWDTHETAGPLIILLICISADMANTLKNYFQVIVF